MADYEKMNDNEFRAALKAEGFDDSQIEEILSSCPSKKNVCVQQGKINVKKKRELKDKSNPTNNTENIATFNKENKGPDTITKLD